MKKKYYWFVGIVFIFILIFSFLWLYFSPKIPEPYNDPQYCDENVNCSFYQIKTWREEDFQSACANMYYANTGIPFSSEKIDAPHCFCNESINKCVEINEGNYIVKAMQKTIDIESASCSGSPDVINFKVKHTGTFDIKSGDLFAYLDNYLIKTIPDIQIYFLKAGEISVEFTYNTSEDKTDRFLIIESPALEVSKNLTCS